MATIRSIQDSKHVGTVSRDAVAKAVRTIAPERVGVCVDRRQKTAVVETTTRVPHPKFGKIVKQVKRFYARDDDGKVQVGDTVRIVADPGPRPTHSKLKRWRLVEIIKH